LIEIIITGTKSCYVAAAAGVACVTSYRLYCLDGRGKITTAEWLDAASDEEALALARDARKPVPCEVWDRERLVGRVEAHGAEQRS
jgi:hypothetical protein